MTDYANGATPFDDADLERLINENVITAGEAAEAAQAEAPVTEADEYDLKARWVPFTLADAYKELSPTEFLIDGLLPVPSLSIITRILSILGKT